MNENKNSQESKKKMIDIKALKSNSIYQKMCSLFSTIYFSVLVIFINLFIFQMTLGFSSTILNLVLSIVAIVTFLILKDGVNEKIKFKKIIFKLILVVSVVVLINGFIFDMTSSLSNTTLMKGVKTLMILLDIGMLVSSLGVFTNEGINNAINIILMEPFLDRFINEAEEIKPGDAVLGYEVVNGVKTDKPVILPLKDRFLHMLILGPTGCGKTSQSITPMINRDMKNDDMGITVLEPKGDLAEKVFGKFQVSKNNIK